MATRRFFSDLLLGADDLKIAFGSGTPEGSLSAEISSLYLRSDATDSATSLYIKDSGSGNTEWVPVAVIPSGALAEEIPFLDSDGNLATQANFTFTTSNNRLAINETTPSSNIHITDGTTSAGITIESTSTATSPFLRFQYSSGTVTAGMFADFVGSSGSELEFRVTEDGGFLATRMILQDNGDLLLTVGDIILGNSGPIISTGLGSPEAVVTADPSSIFLSTNASSQSDALYVKATGTGDTGWARIAAIPLSSSGIATGDIFFLGADGNLEFEATGVLRWDTTNARLGINTDSPDTALHVFDNGEFTSRMIFETTNASNNPGIQFQWDSTGSRRSLIRSVVSGASGTTLEFFTRPDAGGSIVNALTIENNADITIETGSIFALSLSNTTTSDVIYYNSVTGEFTYGAAPGGGGGITGSGAANQITYWSGTSAVTGEDAFTYDPTTNTMTVDNIILNGTSPSTAGDQTIPELSFSGDPNTGIYLAGVDQLGLTGGDGVEVKIGRNLATDNDGSGLPVDGMLLIPDNTDHGRMLVSVTQNRVGYGFAESPSTGMGRFVAGSIIDGWGAYARGTVTFYSYVNTSSGEVFNIFSPSTGGNNAVFREVLLQSDCRIKFNTTGSVTDLLVTRNFFNGGFYYNGGNMVMAGLDANLATFDYANSEIFLHDEAAIAFQGSDTAANNVKLKAPADLATTYTLEWPLAAPTDHQYLEWDITTGRFLWQTGGLTPAGGSSGQALIKDTGTDYDYSWTTIDGLSPSGGTTNQYLKKDSGTDYDYSWTSNKIYMHFTIVDPAVDVYKLMQYSPVAWTIETVYHELDGGTATISIRNGSTTPSNVGGMTSMSVTTTEGSGTASSNDSVSVGNTIDVNITAVSSADMLGITIIGTQD